MNAKCRYSHYVRCKSSCSTHGRKSLSPSFRSPGVRRMSQCRVPKDRRKILVSVLPAVYSIWMNACMLRRSRTHRAPGCVCADHTDVSKSALHTGTPSIRRPFPPKHAELDAPVPALGHAQHAPSQSEFHQELAGQVSRLLRPVSLQEFNQATDKQSVRAAGILPGPPRAP
jgi:hypothetical protein